MLRVIVKYKYISSKVEAVSVWLNVSLGGRWHQLEQLKQRFARFEPTLDVIAHSVCKSL